MKTTKHPTELSDAEAARSLAAHEAESLLRQVEDAATREAYLGEAAELLSVAAIVLEDGGEEEEGLKGRIRLSHTLRLQLPLCLQSTRLPQHQTQ